MIQELKGSVEVAHEARAVRWPARGDDRPPLARIDDGAPLRIALISGLDHQVVRAAKRAALASGAEIACELHVGSHLPFGERAAVMRRARPDAVLIQAHGADADGVVDLVEALRAGCAEQAPLPRAIVSADERCALRLRNALAPFPVELLPDLRTAEGQSAFRERARALRRGVDGSLILRDEALEELAHALAIDGRAPTLIADVTGGSTSLVHATPEGVIQSAHLRPLGIGTAADRVVARAGLDRVRRWIPWAVDSPALLERVFNRARWPGAVPADPLALALEIALAHEALANALAEAELAGLDLDAMRTAPLVVLSGAIAAFPRGAQSLAIALDALPTSGVFAVGRSRDDAALALAALAVRARRENTGEPAPWSPWQRTERVALVATIAPRSRATVRITSAAGKSEVTVERGAIVKAPVSGSCDLTASGAQLRATGEAGAMGLVVDARVRPLLLPPRDAERVPTVAGWFASVGAWSTGR